MRSNPVPPGADNRTGLTLTPENAMNDDRYKLSEAADDVARCWFMQSIIESIFNVIAAILAANAE